MFMNKFVLFNKSVLTFTLKSKLRVLTCNTRIRKYNTVGLFGTYLNHQQQASIISKHLSDFSNVELVEFIKTFLSCSKEKANLLVEQNYDFLCNIKHDKLTESIVVLKKNGVLVSTIQDNFWLLTFGKGMILIILP